MISGLSRREFLKLGSGMAAMMGLGGSLVSDVVHGLESLVSGRAPVVWLQAQSCSGCSVSLLNTTTPGPVELLTDYLSLLSHSTLSTATGDLFDRTMNRAIQGKDYFLVVEGSLPVGMPEACTLHGEPLETTLAGAAKQANAVVAVGTCASFGGIPAAENNPTGAQSVLSCLIRHGITTPVIAIPGCPVHPEWIVGTLVHILKFGIPELDSLKRPRMFFSRLTHDSCPRYSDFEREKFARHFSEPGCLYKLGCMGVKNHSDCSLRLWNSGTNSCIHAGAPCIACTSEFFARKNGFPLYRVNEGGDDE